MATSGQVTARRSCFGLLCGSRRVTAVEARRVIYRAALLSTKVCMPSHAPSNDSSLAGHRANWRPPRLTPPCGTSHSPHVTAEHECVMIQCNPPPAPSSLKARAFAHDVTGAVRSALKGDPLSMQRPSPSGGCAHTTELPVRYVRSFLALTTEVKRTSSCTSARRKRCRGIHYQPQPHSLSERNICQESLLYPRPGLVLKKNGSLKNVRLT